MGGGPTFTCFCADLPSLTVAFLAHSAFFLPELEFSIQTDRLVLAIEHHYRLEVQTPGAACNLYEEQVKIAYRLGCVFATSLILQPFTQQSLHRATQSLTPKPHCAYIHATCSRNMAPPRTLLLSWHTCCRLYWPRGNM